MRLLDDGSKDFVISLRKNPPPTPPERGAGEHSLPRGEPESIPFREGSWKGLFLVLTRNKQQATNNI